MLLHRINNSGWIKAVIATQRIPPGSRLSAWLHGESVMDRDSEGQQAHGAQHMSEKDVESMPTARHHFENYSPAHRSPASPHCMVDPLGSPINFSRPITHDLFVDIHHQHDSYVHPAFASPAIMESPKNQAKAHNQRPTAKHNLKATAPAFFHSKDPRIRRKSIGTLVSGTLLIIVLTTCKTPLQIALCPDHD